ncbi:protein E8 [Elephant endotheliotropic herpesvirus 2]|nr:protein E8 [Elephant endotheliotropic herpesvirus 2]
MTLEGHLNRSIPAHIQKYINLVNEQEIPWIGPDICCFYFLTVFALCLLLVAIVLLRGENRERKRSTVLDPCLCMSFSFLVYYKLFAEHLFSEKSYNCPSEDGQFITVFKRIYLSVLCLLTTVVIALYGYTKLSFNSEESDVIHTSARVLSRRFVPVIALIMLNLDLYSLKSYYYVPSFLDTDTFGFREANIYLTMVSPSVCIDKALDFLLYVLLVISIYEVADRLNLITLTHVPLVFFFCGFTIYSFVQNQYIVNRHDCNMYLTLEMTLSSVVIYLFTKILLMK